MIGSICRVASSVGNLALICDRQGRYEQALTCSHESMAICRELGGEYGQAFWLYDLGPRHSATRQSRKRALASLEERLTIRRKLVDHPGQGQSRQYLGVNVLLAKRDDSHLLALWRDVDVYDPVAHQPCP